MDGSAKQTPQNQDAVGWQYKSEGAQPVPVSAFDQQDAPPVSTLPAGKDSVEWTASEFVAHDKGFGWYALLAIGAIGIAAIIYLVTRDKFSAAVIVLFAIILGIIGAGKPKVVAYSLNVSGVKIGPRFHPYSEYKSFALRDDQPFASIEFIPMKRFALPLSVYLAPENEHEALEVLTRHLPLEQGKPDIIEQLMRQLRF